MTLQMWMDSVVECGYISCFYFRKQLRLKEGPLILMDMLLKNYLNLSNEQLKSILATYIELGEKYKMTITGLFHNLSFDICEKDERRFMRMH